jgi:hypothetical protein
MRKAVLQAAGAVPETGGGGGKSKGKKKHKEDHHG